MTTSPSATPISPEKPKWNPAHDSMWLVWYECRKEVVRVFHGRDGFKGFFAPGQDPLWALDNAEPIMEIVAPADQPTAPATPPAGTETATPETDLATEQHSGVVSGLKLVPADFSRTLERELTASLEREKKLRGVLEDALRHF